MSANKRVGTEKGRKSNNGYESLSPEEKKIVDDNMNASSESMMRKNKNIAASEGKIRLTTDDKKY
jgi:hypothetical protein